MWKFWLAGSLATELAPGTARVSAVRAYGRFAQHVGKGAAVLVIAAFITFAIAPIVLPLIGGR